MLWAHLHEVCVCLVAQSCPTLCNPIGYSPPGSLVHGNSPGKNTGVSCHALLQGIFPTQGSNPGLPHCRRILYQLSYQGSYTSRSYFLLFPMPSSLPHRSSLPFLLSPIHSSLPACSTGKDSRVDCHALLQGIFPTQGSNPCLIYLHCTQVLYH